MLLPRGHPIVNHAVVANLCSRKALDAAGQQGGALGGLRHTLGLYRAPNFTPLLCKDNP